MKVIKIRLQMLELEVDSEGTHSEQIISEYVTKAQSSLGSHREKFELVSGILHILTEHEWRIKRILKALIED